MITIFTDGSSRGNPGPGGYGVILISGKHIKELSQGFRKTTNNRMELLGVITGLEALRQDCQVRVTTDSTYVVKGMTEWMKGWIKNNWRNSQRKEVLNRDLWERLLSASKRHKIEWSWIKGHNGHPENERCDALAREEIIRCKRRAPAGSKKDEEA